VPRARTGRALTDHHVVLKERVVFLLLLDSRRTILPGFSFWCRLVGLIFIASKNPYGLKIGSQQDTPHPVWPDRV
jgi:hypothetical protein